MGGSPQWEGYLGESIVPSTLIVSSANAKAVLVAMIARRKMADLMMTVALFVAYLILILSSNYFFGKQELSLVGERILLLWAEEGRSYVRLQQEQRII